MTLFNTFQTAISGMNAQAKRIEAVSENIANVSTTGYKRAQVEFETALIDKTRNSYTAGGVNSHFRYSVAEQAGLRSTSEGTNLAIQGNGFFVVKDDNGALKLTRAGGFAIDSAGNLVNTAGYRLTGIKLNSGAGTLSPSNIADLEEISARRSLLAPVPSRNGRLLLNLPAAASSVATALLPSTNTSNATFTATSSMTAYDNLGQSVNLDLYYTKTSENAWEVAVYDSRDRSSMRFPYSAGPLIVQQLQFSALDGSLQSPSQAAFTLRGGQTINIDMANITQLGSRFVISEASVDGAPPRTGSQVHVADGGRISIQSDDGYEVAAYQVVIGDVMSPDGLINERGNAFLVSPKSGSLTLHMPNTDGVGQVYSSMVEGSSVDLGSELALMIESQRNYTANTKVFKTAGDMLEVLMTLRN